MQIATTQQQLFDYEALEVIHRQPIQRATEEIKILFQRSVSNYIKIGGKLKESHRRFPTVDLFTDWFRAEFNGSQRTAYNLMRLYDRFGEADEGTMKNIGLSTLYELAAESTPDAAREAVLKLAAAKPVSSEVAAEIIEQTKEAEESALGTLFAGGDTEPETGPDATIEAQPDTDTALCLCGHAWDDHDEATDCRKCTCECYEIEDDADRSTIETLIEQTETTTKTVVASAPVTAPAPAAVKGEGDILFEKATIQIVLTVYPSKAGERDVLVSVKADDQQPEFEYVEFSQIMDIFTNFTLQKQVLAAKNRLVESAAKKKTAPAKPATASKTTTSKTTKTAKKGKK